MNFAFAYPAKIWLPLALIVLVAIGFVLRRFERRRRERLGRFVEASLASRLLVGYDVSIRRPLMWLAILGFVFTALAIAQPHWGQTWQPVTKESRDIMVLLDTSESMNAKNPLPSRLERAKYKISALVDKMPGDRFGLIAFSGGAALECPPTIDHGYFKAVLDAVDTNTLSLEGTDIASALQEAVRSFRDQDKSSAEYHRNQRAILLISDGEEVSGDAMKAAKEAANYARIYVMGVGDPRGTEITMPDWMGRYISGRQGTKPHLSKLDEDDLIRIATIGDGRYVRSEADDWDIDKLYEFMQKVQTRSLSSDVRLRLVNRYQWPLFAAIVLFSVEGLWWVLMPVVRRWRMRKAEAQPAGEQQHA